MKFIGFDIETTGTVSGVDRIVELGAVMFDGPNAIARFSTLVNPKMPIPAGASRVNGITDDMVKDQPTIDQVLGPFAEFCADFPMVAHNAAFDYQFIASDVKLFETPAPKGVVIDTLSISRKVFPGLMNYKLETLITHLKVEKSHFHRAEADATYVGKLFVKILEKIGAETPDRIPNIIALTGKPEFRFPQIIPQPKQLAFLEF